MDVKKSIAKFLVELNTTVDTVKFSLWLKSISSICQQDIFMLINERVEINNLSPQNAKNST